MSQCPFRIGLDVGVGCHDGMDVGAKQYGGCLGGVGRWVKDDLESGGAIMGCIEEFFRVENFNKNMMKSINTISLFCILKSVIKFNLFLLCQS